MNYIRCETSLDGELTDRLFDGTLIRGYTLDEAGNLKPAENWAVTDFIDLTGVKTDFIVACNLDTTNNWFYDSNKTPSAKFKSTAFNNPISKGGTYMRLTSQINRIGKMKIFTEV